MGTDFIIRPWERELFLGCRRAWDFGAHERQGYEAVAPASFLDLERAVKDALAVYYFPGMWDWNRAIVAPLATEGFAKALRTQRAAYQASTAATLADDDAYQASTAATLADDDAYQASTAATVEDDEEAAGWEAASAAGRRMLAAYYDWAPKADKWTTVQVEALFDVTIPDPARPDHGLLAADGRGVLYRLRVDLVVVDKAGRNWIVEHRLCEDGFAELDDLLLDDIALTRSWAWEQGFLGKVAGTIHNELRFPRPDEPGPEAASPSAGAPSTGPDVEWIKVGGRHVRRYNGPWFRRTRIRRKREEIEGAGVRVAEQGRLMARTDLDCYPTPEWSTCRPCDFREPCLALMQGNDPQPALAEHYRPRLRKDFEEGRLGSVWGYVPHRPDQTHVRLNPPPPGP